jgi:hypothetical protein
LDLLLELDQGPEWLECRIHARTFRVFPYARDILLQAPDTYASCERDLAGVGLQPSLQHAEKARLPRAVLADERDHIPRIDGEGDVFEDLLVRERERDVCELGEHLEILCTMEERRETYCKVCSLHAGEYTPEYPGLLERL